ncbi:inclusion body family protein [Photorhabdus luminescens]|uniref:inclusion body family protein n=1 Tax=Photorhabdus luminescens TaxID=29488 RepID=UPI00223F1118|nr:inclusion body family protein [Photorhabdus luminescens]MCW7761201.1 inclusion body family protein [Photorhabdus luminescens subsp. venezuelensis]
MNEIIQSKDDTVTARKSVTADVTFVIDIESIIEYLHTNNLKSSLDPKDPTIIRQHVYIANYTPEFGLKVASSSGARVTVPINANIRWRATTVSNNFDYTIILYKFKKLSKGEDVISVPSQIWSQNPIGKKVPMVPSAVNADEDAPKIIFVESQDSYFQATAHRPGEEQYTWFFAAYDGKKLLGYYRYDPYVEVTNN